MILSVFLQTSLIIWMHKIVLVGHGQIGKDGVECQLLTLHVRDSSRLTDQLKTTVTRFGVFK